jgi:hypothetical protein
MAVNGNKSMMFVIKFIILFLFFLLVSFTSFIIGFSI